MKAALIMVSQKSPMNFSQQRSLFDPDMNAPKVVVIGAGALGSFVVLSLAKMGVSRIEVWDHDYVASHNAPMSLYGPNDIGQYKVASLKNHVHVLTGIEIETHEEAYAGQPLDHVYVISCVDRMSVRKLIWQKVRMNMSIGLFCDTRAGEAYIEVYSIVPWKIEDISRYEATLFDDKDAAPAYCGHHGIIFASLKAASIVSATVAQTSSFKEVKWRVAERCDTLERVF